MTAQTALEFVRDPDRATTLLHPLRRRILEGLRQPDSAAGLARQLDLSRQKVNYHLRELEKNGLVELVEERRKGNCIERIVRATARAYLISPEAVGDLAGDPDRIRDHFSSAYLVTLAATAIRDLGVLRERADRAGKRLATFSLQSEIRFASPAARNAFVEDLSTEIARLVSKYHDETAEGGRQFNLFLGTYPRITRDAGASDDDSEPAGAAETDATKPEPGEPR